MSTWNSVKTDKGLALEAKMISGATLSITRCVTGSGTVPVAILHSQTAVKNIQQTISMESVVVDGNRFSIRTFLTNVSLSTGYNLNQIGFYATDPDEGEILYAIAQISTPKPIPTPDDSPGYGIQFTFTFENSSEANINLTLDTSGIATIEAVEEIVDGMVELGSDITD